ncbi:unnamed protein product [Umbelopsis vinacea]
MSDQQQHSNNHAFQAGFSKAKDEFEAGYKAAIGSHHSGGPTAPGQQAGLGGGDFQQQQDMPQQQQGMPQQQQGMPQQQQMNQPAGGNAQPGFGGQQPGFGGQQPGYAGQQPGYTGAQAGNIGGAQPQGFSGDTYTDAYQQRKQNLNQDPGAGGSFGGVQQQAYDQRKQNLGQDVGAGGALGGAQGQAYQEHKQKLDQDPGAGGAFGGVQNRAYDEHKQSLDQDPGAGGVNASSTGPTAGAAGAGVTGGNLNNQLEQETARHSGPPHGLGSKIKSKLPHHFNDGTKIPRELREDASGQTGPGPM